MNSALIRSNVSIAKVIIRPTQMNVLSGDIDSTKSSISKNMLSSGKLGET